METTNGFRILAVLSVCSLVTWGTTTLTTLSAQSLGGAGSGFKENLDLPYDAAGDNSSDEEAPEVVLFYGTQLEGDGFFYTVDKSGSMTDRGELQRAKAEITRNITEFSDRTEFAVVFFATNVERFPQGGRPVQANPGMKGAAVAWISSQIGASGSCCGRGIMAALQFANISTAKRKVIVYVGDGGGTGSCGGADNEADYLSQTLALITQQNYQRAQINTIGVLMDASRTMQENFLKALAAGNGGTYKRI